TYSQDAQVTDSAPSMSAYMTGVKMHNNVVGMTSETVYGNGNCAADNGKPVQTILELAKAAGKVVGVVTTTEIMDATPAATFGHSWNRNIFDKLAAHRVPGVDGYNPAPLDGVNVLFGGDLAPFTAASRQDGRDLLGPLKTAGYVLATNTAEFT